jgi:hypothetical protein
MKNQILTIFLCVFLPFALMVIAAVLGTIGRLKTGDKIMQGIRDGRFNGPSDPRKLQLTKIRAVVALICLILLSLIIVLIAFRLVPYSAMLIGLVLAITGSICGHLNYKEILDRIK